MTYVCFVRKLIADRRSRVSLFAEGLIADPVWDMMLDLFFATEQARKTSVSSLCIAAGVPTTTALRWIGIMAQKGMCTRVPDPRDRRRIHVVLAPESHAAFRNYLEGIAARWEIQLLETPERKDLSDGESC